MTQNEFSRAVAVVTEVTAEVRGTPKNAVAFFGDPELSPRPTIQPNLSQTTVYRSESFAKAAAMYK